MCALLLAASARCQAVAPTVTLDRVVASIGNVPLTGQDVEQEYRLESFLATGKVPAQAPDAAGTASARTRLINQALLEQTMTQYSFDQSAVDRDAAATMAELRKKFTDQAAFDSALHALGMTSGQLLAKLKEHAEILQMIDGQLRPSAVVSAQEIETYYQKTLVPSYAGKSSPPALKDVRSEIREILVQQKINQLLDQWLAELKKEHPVIVLGK